MNCIFIIFASRLKTRVLFSPASLTATFSFKFLEANASFALFGFCSSDWISSCYTCSLPKLLICLSCSGSLLIGYSDNRLRLCSPCSLISWTTLVYTSFDLETSGASSEIMAVIFSGFFGLDDCFWAVIVLLILDNWLFPSFEFRRFIETLLGDSSRSSIPGLPLSLKVSGLTGS